MTAELVKQLYHAVNYGSIGWFKAFMAPKYWDIWFS